MFIRISIDIYVCIYIYIPPLKYLYLFLDACVHLCVALCVCISSCIYTCNIHLDLRGFKTTALKRMDVCKPKGRGLNAESEFLPRAQLFRCDSAGFRSGHVCLYNFNLAVEGPPAHELPGIQ